ncbi:hypothetical protein ACHAW5_008398 [Stephanodiscus triporus]|uniref:Methyltransferase domain-containing protein n=1 Tax=Stephanodiscus triporus TaxID=2934178 RepID=A0ABD3QFG5_9STRA
MAADNGNFPSCAKVLDELDDRFNERRAPRHKKHRGWEGIKLFDLFEPEATCLSEERFGSESEERFVAFGDGPKFVCGVDIIAAKAKAEGCLIYSVGSNNDIRFEKAVHTHMEGCEIHTFDPTLEPDDFIGGEYATFHPWGLGTDGGKEGIPMQGRANEGIRKSFKTVMKDLGHEHRTIDILKIDCEGCEYAAMPPLFDLIASEKVSVNQVLIELHKDQNDREGRAQRLYDFFLAADHAKFRITHKEGNHWGCDGSRCVEYTFVNESFLRDANGAIVCPSIGDD